MRRLRPYLPWLALFGVAFLFQRYEFQLLDWLGPRWGWLISWWVR